MAAERPFLTADWRHLLMLNYTVDAALLAPFVPRGTELDLWRGEALVSLVGFQFLKTRLRGWRVPWHQNFVEVNLRFYVRREADDGWRRGVVFLKEIVPKRAVTWIANTVYHEHYITRPMSHRVQIPASNTDRTGLAQYRWRHAHQEFELAANFSGLPQLPRDGSPEEFIVEHYWGYSRSSKGDALEYRVTHPAWRVWTADSAQFTGDAAALYGAEFAAALNEAPRSALVAEGSAVCIYDGRRVEEDSSSARRFCEASLKGVAHSGSGLPLVSGASQMMPMPSM
jgi:uncharacterized protein YqjF (DUF2071 family)